MFCYASNSHSVKCKLKHFLAFCPSLKPVSAVMWATTVMLIQDSVSVLQTPLGNSVIDVPQTTGAMISSMDVR